LCIEEEEMEVKMKLIIVMVTLFLVTLLVTSGGNMSVVADPQASATVFVEPPTIKDKVIGETVTINMNVSSATDLYGWQAGITFNPDVLNCTGYYEGEFLERGADPELGTIWLNQTPPWDNSEGIVYFHGCCLLGPVSGVSGSGQLAYLTFEVVGTGVSDLHLTDVILVDSNLESILHEVVDSFTVSWGEVDFSVDTVSNLTGIWGESSSGLFNQTFSQPEKEISFDVITPYDNCYNVTIPAELLGGNLTILIDNVSKDYILTQNATHTSLYFTHGNSTHNIKIKGTTAIPEFPSFVILPLFMIATLLAVIVYRRKHTV
jgi:hypothetical protein